MPWRVGQKVLRRLDIPRSHGWDRTVDKISDNAHLHQRKATQLEDALTAHVIAGDKLIEFHRLEEGHAETIRASLAGLEPASSPMGQAFPATLDKAALAAETPQDPALVRVVRTENALSLIFSSIRILEFRVPITLSDLDLAPGSSLLQFTDIVGIRKEKVQIFQVLRMRNDSDIVELRADYLPDMRLEDAQIARDALRNAANSALAEPFLFQPLNLFAAIDAIYQKSDEGQVVELHFNTTTSSTKQERMRRAGLCLRDELYHCGGKSALTAPIEPFKISVAWDVPLSDEVVARPELTLSSTGKMASSMTPHLAEAILREGVGEEDFDFVISRLLDRLPTPDTHHDAV